MSTGFITCTLCLKVVDVNDTKPKLFTSDETSAERPVQGHICVNCYAIHLGTMHIHRSKAALPDTVGDEAPEAAPGHTWVTLEDGTRTLHKDPSHGNGADHG